MAPGTPFPAAVLLLAVEAITVRPAQHFHELFQTPHNLFIYQIKKEHFTPMDDHKYSLF